MPKSRTEQQVHRAVLQHLRQRGVPGVVLPNGGYRHRTEAAIVSGLGVRAGATDLLLWNDARAFALKLKSPGGQAQIEFMVDMERAGAFTALAEGLNCALETLELWGLLRGKAS